MKGFKKKNSQVSRLKCRGLGKQATIYGVATLPYNKTSEEKFHTDDVTHPIFGNNYE